ncbi:MAG TPA: hypothetical protein VGL94_03320 [Ktedonobacteraceae bacterium]|jgi:hypothetical protein
MASPGDGNLDKRLQGATGQSLRQSVEHYRGEDARLAQLHRGDRAITEQKMRGQQGREGRPGSSVDRFKDLLDRPEELYRSMVDHGKMLMEKVRQINYPDTTDRFQRRYKTEYDRPDEDGYIMATSRLRLPEDLSDQGVRSRIFYQTKIHLDKGIIIVQRAYRTYDNEDWEKKLPETYKEQHKDLAQSLNASQIFGNYYRAVAGTRPLTEITISMVDTKVTSKALAHVVRSGEEKTFSKGSDSYFAVLGSPNGQCALYLLAAHQPDSEVTHISVKSNFGLLRFDLHIGDKQG